jgi:outer membrane protein assembly factor BamB
MYSLPVGIMTAVFTPIALSEEGSTIAVVYAICDDEDCLTYHSRLQWWSTDSPNPKGSIDDVSMSDPLGTSVSSNGRFVVFDSDAGTRVVDTKLGTMLNSTLVNGVICMSVDGTAFITGSSLLTYWQYNTNTFNLIWSRNGPQGFTMESCAMSSGSQFAVGWAAPSGHQNVIEYYNTQVNQKSPTWTFTGPKESGQYPDIPAVISFTSDGSYFAVGSWGNEMNNVPQLVVFKSSSSIPIVNMTVDASIVALDIMKTSSNTVYVVAAGLDPHFVASMAGGDLYLIKISLTEEEETSDSDEKRKVRIVQ